jgi:hypothetical protein
MSGGNLSGSAGLYRHGRGSAIPVEVVGVGGDVEGGAGLFRAEDTSLLPSASAFVASANPFSGFGDVTDRNILKLLADFGQLSDEAPKMAGGFDDAGDSVSKFGQLALDAKGHVQGLIVQSEESTRRLKISMDDVASGFENVVVDSFDRAFTDGFGGFAGNMLKGFAQLIEQLAAQALAANLSKALFGFTGEKDGAGGGWLGKIVGWIGGAIGAGVGGGGGGGWKGFGGKLGFPGHADGGLAKGWSMVGEKGPELAYFGGSGAQIYSNQDSKRMAGGTTNIFNVHFQSKAPNSHFPLVSRNAIRPLFSRRGDGYEVSHFRQPDVCQYRFTQCPDRSA